MTDKFGLYLTKLKYNKLYIIYYDIIIILIKLIMVESCEKCPAAVKITIKKRVKELIEKGCEVIIETINVNGKIKVAYAVSAPPFDIIFVVTNIVK